MTIPQPLPALSSCCGAKIYRIPEQDDLDVCSKCEKYCSIVKVTKSPALAAHSCPFNDPPQSCQCFIAGEKSHEKPTNSALSLHSSEDANELRTKLHEFALLYPRSEQKRAKALDEMMEYLAIHFS